MFRRLEDVAEHEARAAMLNVCAVREAERGHYGQAAFLAARSDVQHAEAIGAAISPYPHYHSRPGLGILAADAALTAGATLVGATVGVGLAAAEMTAAELSLQRQREYDMQRAMYSGTMLPGAPGYGVGPYYPPPAMGYPCGPIPPPSVYPGAYPPPYAYDNSLAGYPGGPTPYPGYPSAPPAYPPY